MTPVYKRILLKLSGEALMGDQEFGISSEVISSYARQIKEIVDMGVESRYSYRRRKYLQRTFGRSSRNGQSNRRSYGNACNCNKLSCSSKFY